ncbi:MAG: hypothetical protein ACPG06_06370 [Alphaproteobacteria bacterium]
MRDTPMTRVKFNNTIIAEATDAGLILKEAEIDKIYRNYCKLCELAPKGYVSVKRSKDGPTISFTTN